MNNLWAAVQVEATKARHSRMLLFTILGIALIPFVGGFFMVILKDPVMARELGLISSKAQIVAGTADWPAYLGLLAQATAIGGIIIFAFVASWVFGREYADRTVKDLLALPTSRSTIVTAKFIVVALWAALLVLIMTALGLLVGTVVLGVPQDQPMLVAGLAALSVTAILTIALVPPIAFIAVAGQGYLASMAFTIVMIIAAQIVAAIGWGEFFPWAIPALYSGVAGETTARLGPVSFGYRGRYRSAGAGRHVSLVWPGGPDALAWGRTQALLHHATCHRSPDPP